jgi:N,N-dimethylformamidase
VTDALAGTRAPDLIGYTDRFSVAPGDQLTFMVSGEPGVAAATLVRLSHADEQSAYGLQEVEVPCSVAGQWRLQHQATIRGSFGLIGPDPTLAVESVSGHLFAYPTRLERGPQGLLASLDADGAPIWELVAHPGGHLVLAVFGHQGGSAVTELKGALADRTWASIAFAIDHQRAQLQLWCAHLGGIRAHALIRGLADAAVSRRGPRTGSIVLAGRRILAGSPEPRATDTFNGKLERPVLFGGVLDEPAAESLIRGGDPAATGLVRLLDLDLGAQPGGWELLDRSPNEHKARLYNAPLRACTSHSWRGDTLTPAQSPEDYAAVHFHDSDLHHANWLPTRTWNVPELHSGVYALRLRASGAEDRIPFLIRPPRGRSTESVALWLPTFTYAAYANELDCASGWSYGDFVPQHVDGDRLLWSHPEWGGSAYDLHSDGSGVAISSLARPVPNLRPTYRQALVNGPRHLAGDLFIVHWLEHIGVDFDVFGDEDLDTEGEALLARYDTVLTGGHPEYVSGLELEAVERYLDTGGRLMYLGGNGFYWVTVPEPGPRVVVEVRRGQAGTRQWNSAPGENHHQFTGEPGGLWRYRGRPPHAMVGVGFTAEGWDGANRPYHRQPASFGPQAAWAFDGIGPDEPIGAGGLVMNGAAGDELDRADPELGTPAETLVLASSSGHSDAYWVVVEDVLYTRAGLSGSTDPRVRADVTLTPKRNGGAVFSVGSISWTASLSHEGYNNPVARLTENVLRTFMSSDAPWRVDAAGEPLTVGS